MTRNGESTAMAGADLVLPNSAPPVAAPPREAERYRLLPLIALTGALILLCIVLAIPFLPSITWGVALAIIAWPLHSLLRRWIAWPGLAAGLSTLIVLAVILGSGFFVAYHLVREAAVFAEQAQSAGDGVIKDKLRETPGIARGVDWMERLGVDLTAEARKFVLSYTQDVSALAQGSITAIIQFLVAIFILFHLFRDRSELIQGVREMLPLSKQESEQVFRRAGDSVHANLYATVVTSLIDALGGALMFWLIGMPSPVLWGIIMFVLSILPIVGAGLVWGPAAAYLLMTGSLGGGLALLAWGALSFCIVDNVIYVRLAGERMRMHQAPAMVAFLGGIAVFGLSGMILGPAIFAVTMAFLEVWKRRMGEARVVTREQEGASAN